MSFCSVRLCGGDQGAVSRLTPRQGWPLPTCTGKGMGWGESSLDSTHGFGSRRTLRNNIDHPWNVVEEWLVRLEAKLVRESCHFA
jgi:hypothetical protein